MSGSAFGNPAKQYNFVRDGLTDMAFGVLAYTPGVFPLAELTAMPFMVEDPLKGTVVLNEALKSNPDLAAECDDVHFLGLFYLDTYGFHMTQPINSFEDAAGARVRVVGAVNTEAAKALGLTPVAFPVTESYDSLQKGTIGGISVAWSSIGIYKLNEVTSSHYESNFTTTVIFTAMNKRFYNSLSDEQRAAIDAVATPERFAKVSNCFVELGEKSRAEAVALGHDISQPSSEDRARYKEMVQPVIDKYIAGMEEKGVPARDFFVEYSSKLEAAQRASD